MFHKQGKTFFPLSVSRTLRTFLFTRWGELGMVDFMGGGGWGAGVGEGGNIRKKKGFKEGGMAPNQNKMPNKKNHDQFAVENSY